MSNLTTFPDARVPSESEVRARTNVLVQFARFVSLNLKMMAMVRKGHH
jgi:hypothetical protein